jgi:hypothetical protein
MWHLRPGFQYHRDGGRPVGMVAGFDLGEEPGPVVLRLGTVTPDLGSLPTYTRARNPLRSTSIDPIAMAAT